jgi:hypothetical protein
MAEVIRFSIILGEAIDPASGDVDDEGRRVLGLVAARVAQSQLVAAAGPHGDVVVGGLLSAWPSATVREVLRKAEARAAGNPDDLVGRRLRSVIEAFEGGDERRAVRDLASALAPEPDLPVEDAAAVPASPDDLRRVLNQFLLVGIEAPGPDLVETAVSSPPAVLTLKEKFTVTDTVENPGSGPAAGTTTRYYLSVDGVAKTTRLGGGGRSVPDLAIDGTSTGSDLVVVPASTRTRVYHLLACADDLAGVLEDDESNNCRAAAGLVEVKAPDLVVTALSDPPATAAVGGSFAVSDTTFNGGNWPAGVSTTRYYLSLDAKKNSGDALVGARGVPSLAPTAASSGSGTATVPASTALGAYFLLACADDLKKVAENNPAKTGEKNNCRASSLKVTVTAGGTGALANGALVSGQIAAAAEVDEWTFSAAVGERIAVHVGEIVDDNDLRPWLRLLGPGDVLLGNTSGVAASVLDDVVAPSAGTYRIQVASFDSGFDGTGTYRLTMTKTPGPITVSAGDQGGPLTNGGLHDGEILTGEVDVWTFTATAGERLAVHIGEIADASDLRP